MLLRTLFEHLNPIFESSFVWFKHATKPQVQSPQNQLTSACMLAEKQLVRQQEALVNQRFLSNQKRKVLSTFNSVGKPFQTQVISREPLRIYVDGVCNPVDRQLLIGGLERCAEAFGFGDDFEPNGEVAVNPFEEGVEEIIGASTISVALKCLTRIENKVKEEFCVDEVSLAGSMLTRLRPMSSENFLQSYGTPHVDKANRFAYDISAVLYLNNHVENAVDQESFFEGGKFLFNDTKGDIAVVPKSGRMLMFNSGASNLHRVEHVTAGSRYTLAVWFSTDTASS